MLMRERSSRVVARRYQCTDNANCSKIRDKGNIEKRACLWYDNYVLSSHLGSFGVKKGAKNVRSKKR